MAILDALMKPKLGTHCVERLPLRTWFSSGTHSRGLPCHQSAGTTGRQAVSHRKCPSASGVIQDRRGRSPNDLALSAPGHRPLLPSSMFEQVGRLWLTVMQGHWPQPSRSTPPVNTRARGDLAEDGPEIATVTGQASWSVGKGDGSDEAGAAESDHHGTDQAVAQRGF